MRLLIDNALSPSIAEDLAKIGHDCIHVRDIGMRAASDHKIFELAIQEDRHVVTADTDFGTIAVASGKSTPSVILLRIQPSTVAEDLEFVIKAIANLSAEIEQGCVVSVQRDGMRARQLPVLNAGA